MTAGLPDPHGAGSLEGVVERLRLLKVWAGDPSYETITKRVNAAWTRAGRPASELARRSTVANCFQTGRRRLNTDLVLAVVEALHPDLGYVARWRQALRAIGGEIEAVSHVRVQDALPAGLADFAGRARELGQLLDALGRAGVATIEGMAGVGKTQLAVHAGHRLAGTVDRVLFVNLRGFHLDPGQPPADPAAVLDGFLRLLGTPGHLIPADLPGRTAAYRDRLTGTRVLVVLDNAATADQVRPLLPDTPGSLAVVTSRHTLDLPGTRLGLDVFTPEEAVAFLALDDPDAAARIARRCGCLPLALSLVAGHIRNTPGWTAADHADRLDDRHRDRRLDSGVELALDLSYQHLPADQQRLLRLTALHPGQDFDAAAAAALSDISGLSHLLRDHLLQQALPGRYTFHDLVRAYAVSRAHDRDPPAERQAALNRLFDHYLATAAAAMDTLYPTAVAEPGGFDADTARGWLETERLNLIAVAAHGRPAHRIRLARILTRYLIGGHYTDAVTIHGHAHRAALDTGDVAEQAHALTELGVAHLRLGHPGPAAEHFASAIALFQQAGDPVGHARAVYSLGSIADRAGRFAEAIEHTKQALRLYRAAGDRPGEANALNGLAGIEQHAGRYADAIEHSRAALELGRHTGSREQEAYALHTLGDIEALAGSYQPAGDHLRQSLALHRQLGNRIGEASLLDSLGVLHTRLGRPGEAVGYHQRALDIFREAGDRDNQTWALNGLGEAALAAGQPADAVTHHTASLAIATELGTRDQQARAHAGLGRALASRSHFERALALYTDLGLPEAAEIRALLAAPPPHRIE